MRRTVRWARRLVGLALLALAARWTIRALQRSSSSSPVAYPNTYGLRLTPLSRDEARDALERERAAVPEIVPGVRIVELVG